MATCCDNMFMTASCEQNLALAKEVPFTNLALLYAGLDSTNVTLDTNAAAQCISGMSALSCASNTATVLSTLSATCSAALMPHIALNGAGCLTSFDCQAGYCGPIQGYDPNYVPSVPDGGGTCMPLLSEGDVCMDQNFSTECTYQGGLTSGYFCSTENPNYNQCEPAVATGEPCGTGVDQECTSGDCAYVAGAYTCVSSSSFEQPNQMNLCDNYYGGP
jgi:hypothetical protein